MTVAWSWDKIAPMCRTVEDCAVVFNAIYGPDGKDNSIIDLPFNWDPDLDIRQLRIGYRTKYFGEELMPTGNLEYTGLVQQESLKVLDFFRDLGIDLLPLDFDINPMSVVGLTMMCENAAAADEMFRSGQGDLIQDSSWPSYWREHRFVPAAEYLQASRYRSLIIQEMNQVFQDIDVYIEITWTSTWLANMTGHPIVVVPCGFVNGRPVSITFVGRLFGEAELLAVAKAFQDGTDYHQRHPDKFIG
jgi:Asp-tRNA(Asn)/Glu-tRNA(Gln) amidotransferase A subunit family amidase